MISKIFKQRKSQKMQNLKSSIAKKLKVDYKSAAIGGLLHDFYTKPWQEDTEKKKFFEKHGDRQVKVTVCSCSGEGFDKKITGC